MLELPAAAMSVARIAAVNSVADTNVVGRVTPLTRTTEAFVKFVPVAVSVKAAPPTATLAGPMLVSIGADGRDCTPRLPGVATSDVGVPTVIVGLTAARPEPSLRKSRNWYCPGVVGMLSVHVLVVTPAPTYHQVGKLARVSGLLEALRATQSVLPPRPFVSVTVTGPSGDVVVLLTVRVGAVAVCVAGGGAVAVLGAVTLRLTLFDVHTPLVQDAWFATWTAMGPWVTTSVASIAILTCVVESTITARAWPPTVAVAPAANPAPVAVSVKAPLPAVTLAGLRLLMFGVGFTRATLSGRAADVPPPGAGVNTVMLGVPAAAISL